MGDDKGTIDIEDAIWATRVWTTAEDPNRPGMFIGWAEFRDGQRVVATSEDRDHLQQTLIELQLNNADNGADRFLQAWKRGVKLFPRLFHCTAESIDAATDKDQLRPNVEAVEWFVTKGAGESWQRLLVMALCSFFNDEWIHIFAKKRRLPPSSPGDIAIRLDPEHREIIADLIVSYRGW